MDFWWCYRSSSRLEADVLRYAICGVILCAVIGGAYYLGYSAGANNTRVEYVEKQVEVIKYVEVERGKIHSSPNINRDTAVRMLHEGQF